MAHDITIGSDPQASAEIQAALVRQDIKTDTAEPVKPAVVYKDPGPSAPDTWKSPAEVNASGEASCNSLTRASAPHVDASHIGVIQVKDEKGNVVRHHSFALKDAATGEAPVVIGGDGKALTPIPADRVHDESAARGMPGGTFPIEAYQGANFAPIHPPHLDDLSHVHAPPADRAAEGLAHQGEPRLHTPQTEAGAAVAAASHLAARVVTPPVTAVPRPMGELYPGHPLLHAVGEGEDAVKAAVERVVDWPTTRRMISQFDGGLAVIAAGANPAPLPGDAPVGPEHVEAAKAMRSHLLDLGHNQLRDQDKPHDAASASRLDATIAALPQLDVADPGHDAKATVVSEVAAMLPSTTPRHVRRALAQVPMAPFYEHGGLDYDRESYGESLGLGLALGVALSSVAAGHPGDGQRPERPRRGRRAAGSDPSMGATTATGGGGGHGGGGGSSPLAPSPSPSPGGSPSGSTSGDPGGPRGGGDSPPGLPPPATAGSGDRDGYHRSEHDRKRGDGDRGGPWLGGGFGLAGGDEDGAAVDGGDDDDEDTLITRRRTITNQEPDRVVTLPGQTRYVREPDRVVPAPGAVVRVAGGPQYESGPWVPPHARHGWVQGVGGEWQRRGGGREGEWTGRGGRGGAGSASVARPNWRSQAASLGLHGAAAADAAKPSTAAARQAAGLGLTKSDADSEAAGLRASGRAVLARDIAADPSLAGPWSGSWGRGGYGAAGYGDRYAATLGDQGLRRAVWAWRNDPAARYRLESGLPVHGFLLADVVAAAGDPFMSGPYMKIAGMPNFPTNMSGGGGSGPWPRGYGRHHYPAPQTVVQAPAAPVYLDAAGNAYPYPVNPDGTPIGADPGMGGVGARGDRGDRPGTSPWSAATAAAIEEEEDDAPVGRRGGGRIACACPSAR